MTIMIVELMHADSVEATCYEKQMETFVENGCIE